MAIFRYKNSRGVCPQLEDTQKGIAILPQGTLQLGSIQALFDFS